MYKFSRTSASRLRTCHNDLQRIMNEAVAVSNIDFGIAEGHRSIEKQQQYYKEGKSKIDGVNKIGKHNLKPADGAVKKGKRIARGQGSGRGGTSTKGHKGAQSRSGYSAKLGFEGGQMPLQRRVPKFGFKNPNRVEYVGINLDRLQDFATKHNTTDITLDGLMAANMIKKTEVVKILGRGEITGALNVKVNAFTKSAKEAIEKAGGSAETI